MQRHHLEKYGILVQAAKGEFVAVGLGACSWARPAKERGRVLQFSLSNGGKRAQAAERWAVLLLSLVATPWHSTHAQAPVPARIVVELNKLEPLPASAAAPGSPVSGPGCRAYIVASNPDAEPVTQLRLDLVLFGTDGVITRRVAFDLGPLVPRKTAVRLFDLPGQPCDGIGRVLVNDVLACQLGPREEAAAAPPQQACLDRLQLSSRAKAELTK